ncbi:MAG: AcrR family transcriptional regulator [Polaribacter sp.]|jgi:AcrR family transcriptional regulator
MPGKEKDTESKIKEAARKVFQEKGFSATKTRDIAEEAGINLALLNYYFRSKKKLFDLIMLETLQSFFAGLVSVLDNEESSLKEKMIAIVNHYMDQLSENQNMAPFILNAIRENPDDYIAKIGLLNRAKGSVFIKQFQEAIKKGEIPPINPLHFMLNLMGLIVFPFIAQPMICVATGIQKELFFEMIQERRRLIPLWIETMLSVK